MLRFLTMFALIGAFLPASVQAEPWPDYTDPYVNDFAGVLTEDRATRLRQKLQDLRARHDIEMTVVTIATVDDYDDAGSWEAFATRLFNGWGIGNPERNDGVLFLFAMTDRNMRLELGSGYVREWDEQARQIVDNIMVPNFKNGNPQQGIEAGVGTMIARIETNLREGRAATDGPFGIEPMQQFEIAPDIRTGGGGVLDWIWYTLIVPVLGAGAWGIRRVIRLRPRSCARCQTRMTLLDEISDDAHLDEGSLLEETIESVDYDVWQCPACQHAHIERWRNWFSRYGACRACNYRALESDTTILSHATTSSTGRKRIDYNCVHCGEAWSETKTIPRKSKSSSSSSSSFSGGSSSGGGASGSW